MPQKQPVLASVKKRGQKVAQKEVRTEVRTEVLKRAQKRAQMRQQRAPPPGWPRRVWVLPPSHRAPVRPG
jgi:hypothetical protein